MDYKFNYCFIKKIYGFNKLQVNQNEGLPVTLTERMKTKLVCYLRSIHCIGQILFVGEDEQNSIPKFILEPHENTYISN